MPTRRGRNRVSVSSLVSALALILTGCVQTNIVSGEFLIEGPGVDTLPARSPNGSTIGFSSDRP